MEIAQQVARRKKYEQLSQRQNLMQGDMK